MAVEHVTAPGAPAPGGSYSHGVVANGFLYTCGMGPVDPATGKKISVDGVSIDRIENGMVVSGFDAWDSQVLVSQISSSKAVEIK
jgi:enamine deaminase RidA (YjgF/YER057c/UK114 family)